MRYRRWNEPSLGVRLAAYAVLAFMHLPVLVIVLYAFTTADRTYEFPPPGLTLHWFEAAFARADIWAAMRLSLAVAAVATVFAIILGSLTVVTLLALPRIKGGWIGLMYALQITDRDARLHTADHAD